MCEFDPVREPIAHGELGEVVDFAVRRLGLLKIERKA